MRIEIGGLLCGLGLCVLLMASTGCGPTPGQRVQRKGDEIIVAGEIFHIGTPVVLWIDPTGYDAYRAYCHFKPTQTAPSDGDGGEWPHRFNLRRKRSPELAAKVQEEGWTLENLQQQVDQFVYHYDVAGCSRRCFEILHDIRGLSVQFMLDVDGVLYQTLDLKERAWHAGTANDRCVGIEIANIGAYGDMKTLNQWYRPDEQGWPMLTFPNWIKTTGILTPDFVARPARKDPIKGRINGREVVQYDYTPEQYEALIKLTAAMHRIFPKMNLDCPRNSDGSVRMDVFNDEEQDAFSGFMGHWHESKGKVDPGPAFDWEKIFDGARRELSPLKL